MSELNVLNMPLCQRQVIEASAGTGKTWTLSALYLRLVIGHGRPAAQGLKPSQILVMTFTEAATAELRERIRQRLGEAATYLDHRLAQRKPQDDPFLHDLCQQLSPDDWTASAALLRAAAQNMDDAAIFTIHGWSRRMLSSFALQSRDMFEQTHLDNPQALLHNLINDYWRRFFTPLPLAAQEVLQNHWKGDPQKLLAQVQQVWRLVERQPQAINHTPLASPAQVLAPFLAWQAQHQAQVALVRQAWSSEVAQALLAAQAAKRIKGSRADYFANWVNALQAWADQGLAIDDTTLARFGLQQLQSKGWQAADTHPVFALIDDLLTLQAAKPLTHNGLIEHAATELREQYQQAKLQQSVFDFSDLLQRLHTALHADQGEMAAAIRSQYPVALVDEFQDTDPWQYQSLDRIYDRKAVDPTYHALVMIGDPKQAIYSFRGADLQTYVQARNAATLHNPLALHTLDSNFRSQAGLVRALNHIFGQVPDAFHTAAGNISYAPVHSRSDALCLTDANGQTLRAVQVLHLPLPDDSDKPHWPASDHVQHMAHGFATTMVGLLAQHSDVQPGDMAVLVRSHTHAKAMQAALRQRNLPSVLLSDNANVFQSEEALDLWRVLRAIASPRQSAWMRSAMASGLWGLSLSQLACVLHDEAHADGLAESCHRWLQQWQRSGVLPMLHSWMHEQHIAARLLAQPLGERRLTHLLHLGELLQDASQHVQGPQALLQYLADNMAHSSDNPEAQKMRLETDAQCVQIITFHKSKGLEYPLVFVPFMGSLSAIHRRDGTHHPEDDEAPDPTESSVEEDMRLLYVALTRAKRGLWLGLAATANALVGQDESLQRSAVSRLLQRSRKDDLWQRLQAAWGNCEDIAIQPLPAPSRTSYPGLPIPTSTQGALTPQRAAHRLWWTASFSSLTRGLEAGTSREEAYTDGLTDAALVQSPVAATHTDIASPWQSFPAGARYGTLLHDLLQYQAQQGWPIASPLHDNTHDLAWQALCQRKCDWLQLPLAAQDQLHPWLQAIVTTPLPLTSADAPALALAQPLVLQRIASPDLWAEMEFSLPVGQLSSKVLDAQIRQHVMPGLERPALQPKVMQGMLSGFMDLVLQHQGRYWVLDYKSNLLPDYELPELTSAVLSKRYEVQYVLYTLALHRLLASRLPDYDYDTHMGGAIYVFLRGIATPTAGVHTLRAPRALIEQLDRLFAKAAP